MDNDKTKKGDQGAKEEPSLTMDDVAINTMKSDLAKVDGKDNKSGWFDFLSKHQEEKSAQIEEKKSEEKKSDESVPETEPAIQKEEVENLGIENGPEGQINELSRVLTQNKVTEENPLEKTSSNEIKEKVDQKKEKGPDSKLPENSLEEELEAFKEETENKIDKKEPISDSKIPDNLPIVEESQSKPSLASFFPPKEEKDSLQSENSSPNKLLEMLQKGKEEVNKGENQNGPTIEFKGSLEETNKEKNDNDSSKEGPPLQDSAEKEADENKPLPMEIKKFTLEDEEEKPKEGKIGTIAPFRNDGLAGTVISSGEENPFAAHLDPREREGTSLLQKVESAINYSAAPEFAKEREAGEAGLEKKGEDGKVVNLKEGKDSPIASKSNKKLIFIGVGVAGVVMVFLVLFLIIGSGSKTDNTAVSNKNVNVNNNVNTNTNSTTVVKPLPINDNVDLTPKIAIQKVIGSTESKVVASPAELSTAVGVYKKGTAVSKLTQLIFAKSNGSSLSLADLMMALKIKIPTAIISNSDSVPALFFVDYFDKSNVFALIIPTESKDEDLFSKMSSWETNMVSDLKPLWDNFSVDNENGYFSNSKLFANSRYVLIDKKTGMSLDYAVNDGNVFITFGRFSMQALNKEFLGIQKTSGSGIKWEATSSSGSSSSMVPESDAEANSNLSNNSNDNLEMGNGNENENAN